MFGVFGADVFMVAVMCILAVMAGIALAGLFTLILNIDSDPFEAVVFILIALMIGALGCAYIISQPDGYVGEAKYVENTMNYEEGSGTAVPIVEVEGKGRFPVDGSGIVSYEVGDMIPVECYYDACDVKVVSP